MTIGERIAALRDKAKLSQHELSQRAKVTQATVSRIESGSMEGSHETINKLLAVFGKELGVVKKSK